MANLGKKDGMFVVRFRYQGKEFKKSLKTRSEDAAKAALHVVELTIHRLHTGQAQIGEGIDPGDFIVSGGTWVAPRPSPALLPSFPTTRQLIERYLSAKQGQVSENYLNSQRTHLGHLSKFLGQSADEPCNKVNRTTLENFLRDRKKIRDGETVNREQVTLKSFYDWIALQDDISSFPFPAEKLPRFKGSRDRDPFKTFDEIEATIARGGFEERQVLEQWESLYLDPSRIALLLTLVQQRAPGGMSFLLHAIPAYTGMRRGEIIRLSWADVDLAHDYIIARSRKQSRSQQVVIRRIDLHPELKSHLVKWKHARPKGQQLFNSVKGDESLNVDQANALFWQPMRGTNWCLDSKRNWFKIGFHTYRHSFASNLAAANVDQRMIDEFMGHTTEAMRKRYRHLYPSKRREAIETLSYVTPAARIGNATS